PQWPESGESEGRRPVPPAPGQSTGRRALPEPHGFPSAEPSATGSHAFPEPPGYPPADPPPTRHTDRRVRPDTPGQRSGSYPVPPVPGQNISRRARPDDGYGPHSFGPGVEAAHRAAFDNGLDNGLDNRLGPGQHTGRRAMPDQGFGPATPGSDFGPPADGGFSPFDSGFGPGTAPDGDFGPSAAPDNGFGPAAQDRGFGPAAPDTFGPGPSGFGPGAAPDGGFGPGTPDSGFGPGPTPHDDFRPAANYGFDRTPGPAAPDGFGPGVAPDNGFGPGAPERGFGPGAGTDHGFGAPADNGFGPSAAPANGFGPGAESDNAFGPRAGAPERGFGPGGPAENGFGPGAGRGAPEGGFGPGQGTGRRAMPPGGFGPGGPGPTLPPGQASGPRPVPPAPGQSTGGRPLPPGHSTGSRPLPEGLRGPGQSSGYRAIPGDPGPLTGDPMAGGHQQLGPGDPMPGGRHPSGPLPRDPMPGSRHLSGPIPRDQLPGGHHPSGPLPGDQPGGRHPSGPGEQPPGGRHPSGPLPRPADPMMDGAPPIPAARPGGQEPVGQRSMPGGQGPVPLPPPRLPEEDAISMTAEMEAIGEEVQKRRGIDHTLARFSAVHDEIQAEERERKAKRRKLMPWRHDDEEMDRLDELVAGQTINGPRPQVAPQQADAPEELAEMLPDGGGPTRLQEKKSRRRTRSTLAIRAFAATAAILVFVATGIAWGFKSWVDASSQQVDALDPNSDAIQDAAKQSGDENFLLVGSDTRAGAAAEDGAGDEGNVLGARSDTVMIAHIPANRERAVVVSFPRDLEVTRPACEAWDPKSGDYTGERKPAEEGVKLNTAYQVGGPKCVTKMVQQLSGLMINHFVGVDFNGFKGMVDAVDGVQVCVERPLKDDVLGTIVPVAGENVTLSGDEALNFVRARHVQGDVTSDYGRIIRQQRFLSSLLRKAMSSEVLLDPGKLTGFVQAFSKSTFGDNIGVEQMFTLGQSLQGIEAGRVTFVTVPTVGEANERGNEDLRVDDTKALFSAIREDSPLPGESPGSGTQQLQSGLAAQPSGPVDPKTIKLQVFNGGNPTGGIAGATADQLADLGYQIVWVDAAPENVDRTVIKYAKGSEAQARTLGSSVPDAELVEDPSLAGAVQLIIGPGFDGEVVAPGEGSGGQPLPEDLSTVNGGDVSCA
ncbi:LCP family protein, partial [Actinophytocola sp.]|uniref:LCP family protein n=1 Tax=Actinophytocola sp. TaxID=1872138 RepID=UPI003D6C4FAE